MDAALPSEIKDILRQFAVSTRANQDGIPVLLEHICSELEIPVKRQATVPAGKAFLSWDRKRERVPTIWLPIQRHRTWDRFCAAHELGHYVLISQFEWVPKGNKQYWITEDLCDYFARNLLIPEETYKPRASSPFEALDCCDEIAATAIVPWKQAAEWVCENSSAFVMVLEPGRDKSLTVTASTLPNRQGRFMPLTGENVPSKFRELVQQASRLRSTVQEEVTLAGLGRTKISAALQRLVGGKIGIRAYPQGRIHLAGLLR